VPPVATSSHRPYVSRRKRHHSSRISRALGRKVTLGLFGLLLAALVVSLGIIVFSVGRPEEAASLSYEAPVEVAPTAPAVSSVAPPADLPPVPTE
jgi:hypothetical protein